MEPIRTVEGLAEAVERLSGSRLVAVDTEAAGYHRYFDRVCLIQLSTREHTSLVDTLAIDGLEPLRDILADDGVEKVFHDADYDLRLLDRDYGLQVRGLFDTKLAGQFLGEPAIGLASLLEKHVGVTLEKKYQRADWARRPLPDEWLDYAAEDTRHLPLLRDRLREGLVAANRLHWAEEEFRLQEEARWTEEEDPDAYRRLKGARDLPPRSLAALRALHAWREAEAERRDTATFRVLGNQTLVEIAQRMPQRPAELERIRGVSRPVFERYGRALLDAVGEALRLSDEELPRHPRPSRRPPPDPEFDERVTRLKDARDRAATALGLDRGFLMPRSQLEEIARRLPSSREELAVMPGIRAWQIEAVGDEVLAALGT